MKNLKKLASKEVRKPQIIKGGKSGDGDNSTAHNLYPHLKGTH